jgi:hypothetical protein
MNRRRLFLRRRPAPSRGGAEPALNLRTVLDGRGRSGRGADRRCASGRRREALAFRGAGRAVKEGGGHILHRRAFTDCGHDLLPGGRTRLAAVSKELDWLYAEPPSEVADWSDKFGLEWEKNQLADRLGWFGVMVAIGMVLTLVPGVWAWRRSSSAKMDSTEIV